MAIAAIKGERTIAQIAEHFDVHSNQVTTWKTQLEGGAADVFGDGNGSAPAVPAVGVKLLHAKIGELTLESTFATRTSIGAVLHRDRAYGGGGHGADWHSMRVSSTGAWSTIMSFGRQDCWTCSMAERAV